MKKYLGIIAFCVFSTGALAHEPGEPGEDLAIVCGRTSTSPQVTVTVDKTEGHMTVTLPNGNQADGHYVKTTNMRDKETLYVLNTGGTLIADMAFGRGWISTVGQVVVREKLDQYDIAFNVANYTPCGTAQ